MITLSPFKSFKISYFIGLGLNLIAFIAYLSLDRISDSNGYEFFGSAFLLNYGMALGYLGFLLIGKFSQGRPRPSISYACWINVLVLFTISAFSLNLSMNVFAEFPEWLNIYILVMVALFFIYPYINNIPAVIRAFVYGLSGCSLLLSFYMFYYLLPIMPITGVTFWFFGISLHALAPACWLWLILDFFIRKGVSSGWKHFIWLGMSIPLIFLGIYIAKWNRIQTDIKDVVARKNLEITHQLPTAILLAQKLPSDPITDEILVSPFKSQRFWTDEFRIDGNEERKFHDPLALISMELFGPLDLDINTTETILNIRKDYRHKTNKKLWTGTNLITTSISNNIRIFPSYRLAYQEKTIVIHDDPYKTSRDFWFTSQTQEALYTFHVPEGSIVTSLSLWINGKEQKSRLSTLQKADSAYSTIVGVERRDPSIVRWQEGNRVTVNVFPCTLKEDRTFKIGFTTPLSLRDGKLWLENIWFEGPDFNSAREATKVSLEGESKEVGLELPDEFQQEANGDYLYTGDYLPDWKISLMSPPLSNHKFTFNGYDYSIKELSIKQSKKSISQIYLDVTKEWTREEYESVLKEAGDKLVYTWLPGKVQIIPENRELIWKEVSQNQFSIPFLYDIKDADNTIIITKTNETSPLLSDLKSSDYSEQTLQYLLSSERKILVANIGNHLSPLWRSLHELRLINYTQGTVIDVLKSIHTGIFHIAEEDSSMVSLNDSHLSILKEASSQSEFKNSTPDHLLRIFAYNDVMRKIGKHYYEKEKYETDLFRQAEEGYVVTPVTSMIVLESQSDYEKFGIDANKNSVGNASVIGGGGVLEPREWLLISLAFVFILFHVSLKNKIRLGNYFKK